MPATALNGGVSEEISGSVRAEADAITRLRNAQRLWAQLDLSQRLSIVRKFRNLLAANGGRLAELVSPLLQRATAETLSAEVMPLAEAARFLELRAGRLLQPQRLSSQGRPGWLRRVEITVQRDAYGVVLIVGPANYPLFLPGVQALQALVAGNAVIWKPGAGGKASAEGIAALLIEAGLDRDLILVTDESAEPAQRYIDGRVDKVVMTGSAASGRSVLARCAEMPTEATVELSGSDCVFILPDADIGLAVRALKFGLALNWGATCISPRRVFVHAAIAKKFEQALASAIQEMPHVSVAPRFARQLADLVEDAQARGAGLLTPFDAANLRPVIVTRANPDMAIMQADIFAPVLAVMTTPTIESALEASSRCGYALGASIFGSVESSRRLAERIAVGVVVINDMIVPTADPRLSFGGRKNSGWGKTRGAEGLLEMTVSKSIAVQRGKRLRHLEPAHPRAANIFEAYLRLSHGGGIAKRVIAAADLCKAALSWK